MARIIVKLNKVLLVFFAIVCVFCALSLKKANINYSIPDYLPDSTDTKQALEIMDDEFITYGSSTILIRNISYEEASSLAEDIRIIDGVKSLPFENTKEYYNSSSALFTVTFDGTAEDARCLSAYDKVVEQLQDYDAVVATKLKDDLAETLVHDTLKILIVVAIIVVAVLLFTSRSFAEVLVFLIVFVVSALLNKGTNCWLPSVSFISDSICVVLQLALAIDYAIILSHRFTEEKERGLSSFEAQVNALHYGIPEIFGSSLTTIAGLLALCCMSFKLGADLGICLAKSIVASLITVFFLMPSLMIIFSKAINKTKHKNFVPKITGFGKFVYKLRYVLPIIFIALVGVSAYYANNVEYCFSDTSIVSAHMTESKIADKQIAEIFGTKNTFAIVVPKDDEFALESEVVSALKNEDMIVDLIAISDVSLYNNGMGVKLTEPMNYRDFAHFIGINEDIAKETYLAFSYLSSDGSNKEAVKFSVNPDEYYVSLLEFANYAIENTDIIEPLLGNEVDLLSSYISMKEQIIDAQKQLIGEHYTRIICNIDGPIESAETFALIDRLKESIKGEISSDVIFAGNSMSSYDLSSSFSKDNALITILSIVFVYIILMFTCNTWGVPLLQVATIQGAIFINFAIPAIKGESVFFFVYLIVSAIQMGATIDYAIVLTGRYGELVEKMDKKTAVIETMNQVFPTILTSSIILMSAGFLVYFMVRKPLIATLGLALGRGTIISVLSVLCVLPCLLFLFYDKLKKTKIPTFDLNVFQDLLKELNTNEKNGKK